MAKCWYCKIEGVEIGPLTAAELRGLVEQGSLSRTSLVRRAEDQKWRSADRVSGLFPTISTTPAETYSASRTLPGPQSFTRPAEPAGWSKHRVAILIGGASLAIGLMLVILAVGAFRGGTDTPSDVERNTIETPSAVTAGGTEMSKDNGARGGSDVTADLWRTDYREFRRLADETVKLLNRQHASDTQEMRMARFSQTYGGDVEWTVKFQRRHGPDVFLDVDLSPLTKIICTEDTWEAWDAISPGESVRVSGRIEAQALTVTGSLHGEAFTRTRYGFIGMRDVRPVRPGEPSLREKLDRQRAEQIAVGAEIKRLEGIRNRILAADPLTTRSSGGPIAHDLPSVEMLMKFLEPENHKDDPLVQPSLNHSAAYRRGAIVLLGQHGADARMAIPSIVSLIQNVQLNQMEFGEHLASALSAIHGEEALLAILQHDEYPSEMAPIASRLLDAKTEFVARLAREAEGKTLFRLTLCVHRASCKKIVLPILIERFRTNPTFDVQFMEAMMIWDSEFGGKVVEAVVDRLERDSAQQFSGSPSMVIDKLWTASKVWNVEIPSSLVNRLLLEGRLTKTDESVSAFGARENCSAVMTAIRRNDWDASKIGKVRPALEAIAKGEAAISKNDLSLREQAAALLRRVDTRNR